MLWSFCRHNSSNQWIGDLQNLNKAYEIICHQQTTRSTTPELKKFAGTHVHVAGGFGDALEVARREFHNQYQAFTDELVADWKSDPKVNKYLPYDDVAGATVVFQFVCIFLCFVVVRNAILMHVAFFVSILFI